MNGLSLCAGVGGLDLGVEIAFENYQTIAAVEHNYEAARRFKLRFPKAKVFEDLLGFDGRRLNGIVDCVVAGWPCQPHSVAGQRLGTADERWIWDHVARVIKETGAWLFIGENVSGLLRDAHGSTADDDSGADLDDDADDIMGGMGTVLRDLAEMGFVSVWGSLRASEVGASHGRPRVFIVGVRLADSAGRARTEGRLATPREEACGWPQFRPAGPSSILEPSNSGTLDDPAESRLTPRAGRQGGGDSGRRQGEKLNGRCDAVADASGGQLSQQGRGSQGRDGSRSAGEILADTPTGGLGIDGSAPRESGHLAQRNNELADAERAGFERPDTPELRGTGRCNEGREPEPFPGPQIAGELAHNDGARREAGTRGSAKPGTDEGCLYPVENATRIDGPSAGSGRRVRGTGDELDTFAPGPANPAWTGILATVPHLAPALSPVTAAIAIAISQGTLDIQAEIESGFCGLADGVARWLVERRSRLQCGGNGVVPLQAAAVITELARRLGL